MNGTADDYTRWWNSSRKTSGEAFRGRVGIGSTPKQHTVFTPTHASTKSRFCAGTFKQPEKRCDSLPHEGERHRISVRPGTSDLWVMCRSKTTSRFYSSLIYLCSLFLGSQPCSGAFWPASLPANITILVDSNYIPRGSRIRSRMVHHNATSNFQQLSH